MKESRTGAIDNILQTIGRTPLVRLNRSVSHLAPALYAKVEYFNPGGSAKDRVAFRMIEDAEREGRLKPGGTIVEATAGNVASMLRAASRAGCASSRSPKVWAVSSRSAAIRRP